MASAIIAVIPMAAFRFPSMNPGTTSRRHAMNGMTDDIATEQSMSVLL